MYRLSGFVINATQGDSVIYRSTKTGAVALLSTSQNGLLKHWLDHQDENPPDFISSLLGDNKILVDDKADEFGEYVEQLLDARNNRARIFSLHVEPTMQCQLDCGYCFQKGVERGKAMSEEVFGLSVDWLGRYFDAHREIKVVRTIFFGGEPLLRKDILKKCSVAYSQIANEGGLEYITELVTNGQLLDERTASFLSRYNWQRVQITLDGPARVHDSRRKAKSGRPTFERIWNNILMLAKSEFVPTVDVRLSLDSENVDSLPELIGFMSRAGIQDRVRFSIGFVEPSLSVDIRELEEGTLARKALEVWRYARDLGFPIPDEFTSGPLCIAQAKHSAVLQPDGRLQKCFCTSGMNRYAFGDLYSDVSGHTRDPKYENFARLSHCASERCPYLPICGGGCTFQAAVENGGTAESFSFRRCKRTLLHDLNEGLLRLSYQRS